MECNANSECVVVDGQGSDQCSVNLNCESDWEETGYTASYTTDEWSGEMVTFHSPCDNSEYFYSTFRYDFPDGCDIKIGDDVMTVDYPSVASNSLCTFYVQNGGAEDISGSVLRQDPSPCEVYPDDGFRPTDTTYKIISGAGIYDTSFRLEIFEYGDPYAFIEMQQEIPVGSYVTISQQWPENEIIRVTGYRNDGTNNYPYVMDVERALFDSPRHQYYQHNRFLKQVDGFSNNKAAVEGDEKESFNLIDWFVGLFN